MVTEPDIRSALVGWSPAAVESARQVDPWHAAAFADLLDAPSPENGRLPPLWHWFTLIDHPAQADLGPDGHPRSGSFLPPIPNRRRMFAGGRLEQWQPIPFGSLLSVRTTLQRVEVKTGRTGAMVFVTTRHRIAIDGTPVAVEEQDAVYRSDTSNVSPRPAAPWADEGPSLAGRWRIELTTDPVLLARFSALTYNGHRIHYDWRYATEVEGYPGLVIHGPLQALLALELPRRNLPDRTIARFSYRLLRPAFVPSRLVCAGDATEKDAARLVVAAEGAPPSMTATVQFTPSRECR